MWLSSSHPASPGQQDHATARWGWLSPQVLSFCRANIVAGFRGVGESWNPSSPGLDIGDPSTLHSRARQRIPGMGQGPPSSRLHRIWCPRPPCLGGVYPSSPQVSRLHRQALPCRLCLRCRPRVPVPVSSLLHLQCHPPPGLPPATRQNAKGQIMEMQQAYFQPRDPLWVSELVLARRVPG